LILLVAIKFSEYRPKSYYWPVSRRKRSESKKPRVCTEKSEGDRRDTVVIVSDIVGLSLYPAETGSVWVSSSLCQLHGTAVEHVEHARVGRATCGAIVAHKVVNAHTRPGRGRLRGGRRGCPPIATGWRWLKRCGVVGRRSRTRSGGGLRVWRGGGSARLISVRALWRRLARRLRSVVRLCAWWWRVGVGGVWGCCSWAGQILLLLAWLLVRLCVARRRKRLAICAVHGWRLPDTTPDSVSRDESLCLRRDWSEDAVLIESHAVGAAAILGRLEARASDLATPAVPTGNGSALARSWWLVMLLDILRRRGRLPAIWILRRRAPIPLVGPRKTVGLLVLRMLVGSHVGAWLLRWWRWEGGAHMCRRRVCAVGRLL
jgi:hypothetical protein